MKKFIVISSNPNSKGGFVTKLQSKIKIETIFGVKEKSLTYYVSGTKQLAVDTEVDVDMTLFLVMEHEMINPSTNDKFMGKWLHLA